MRYLLRAARVDDIEENREMTKREGEGEGEGKGSHNGKIISIAKSITSRLSLQSLSIASYPRHLIDNFQDNTILDYCVLTSKNRICDKCVLRSFPEEQPTLRKFPLTPQSSHTMAGMNSFPADAIPMNSSTDDCALSIGSAQT